MLFLSRVYLSPECGGSLPSRINMVPSSAMTTVAVNGSTRDKIEQFLAEVQQSDTLNGVRVRDYDDALYVLMKVDSFIVVDIPFEFCRKTTMSTSHSPNSPAISRRKMHGKSATRTASSKIPLIIHTKQCKNQ